MLGEILAFALQLASHGESFRPPAVVAPLPEGLTPSNQVKLWGIYAERRFGSRDVQERKAALETACAARGVKPRIDGLDLEWQGRTRIYRTRDSVAVFEERPEIAVDEQGCTARISLRRSSTAATGPWSRIRPAEWREEPVDCEGRGLRCREEEVAEIKATCFNLGDSFQGTSMCVSDRNDLTRGLYLSSQDYTDTPDPDAPEPGWEMSRVLTSARIDPVVFRTN